MRRKCRKEQANTILAMTSMEVVSPCPPPQSFYYRVICRNTLCADAMKGMHQHQQQHQLGLSLKAFPSSRSSVPIILIRRSTWRDPHWVDGAPDWPTTPSRNFWRAWRKQRQDSGRDSHASNNLKIPKPRPSVKLLSLCWSN
ncbi:Tubulin beta chain [Psidium guajava]|nr:Tubulin beta chain [Psidium guajava]